MAVLITKTRMRLNGCDYEAGQRVECCDNEAEVLCEHGFCMLIRDDKASNSAATKQTLPDAQQKSQSSKKGK